MKRYAKFVLPAIVVIGILTVLMLNLSSSLVYYNTPAEMAAREADETRLRLAGRVTPGSVVEDGGQVTFSVDDCLTSVVVEHTGNPPQLFQEGIGVVVEGAWNGETFVSDMMLVKHDEQYRAESGDYDEATHSCSQS